MSEWKEYTLDELGLLARGKSKQAAGVRRHSMDDTVFVG